MNTSVIIILTAGIFVNTLFVAIITSRGKNKKGNKNIADTFIRSFMSSVSAMRDESNTAVKDNKKISKDALNKSIEIGIKELKEQNYKML